MEDFYNCISEISEYKEDIKKESILVSKIDTRVIRVIRVLLLNRNVGYNTKF